MSELSNLLYCVVAEVTVNLEDSGGDPDEMYFILAKNRMELVNRAMPEVRNANLSDNDLEFLVAMQNDRIRVVTED